MVAISTLVILHGSYRQIQKHGTIPVGRGREGNRRHVKMEDETKGGNGKDEKILHTEGKVEEIFCCWLAVT
jgi:hypothetical protein